MYPELSPLVSVIIPTFNHQEYIKDCIDSVLNQSYSNLEVLISDDNSSDQTPKIISQYQDVRISFTRNEKRIGQFATTNALIKKAKGEYIAILNSDDIFNKDKIQKQINYLSEHVDVSAVFCHIHPIDENGKDFFEVPAEVFNYKYLNQNNRSRHEWLNFLFYHGNCFCHPTVLMKKSCHDDIGLYNQNFRQIADFDLWIRMLLRDNIHILEEPLLKFRIHRNNTSRDNNIEVQVRTAWELYHTLHHFLSIQSLEEFNNIFPDNKTPNTGHLPHLLPFFIAQKALSVNHPPYKKFAIDTIYNLLQDDTSSADLKNTCNFSSVDFMKLSGLHDTFNFAYINNLKVGKELRSLDLAHGRLIDECDQTIKTQAQLINDLNTRLEALSHQLEQITSNLTQTLDYRLKKRIRQTINFVKDNT